MQKESPMKRAHRLILSLAIGTIVLGGTIATTPVAFGCGTQNSGGCRKADADPSTSNFERDFFAALDRLGAWLGL